MGISLVRGVEGWDGSVIGMVGVKVE
jgi:hypothetical protein